MPPVSALFRLAALIAFTLVLSFSTALAQKRVALVIGNSSYAHVPALPNPTNDSAKVALKLKSIGFEVLQADNLDFDGFREPCVISPRRPPGPTWPWSSMPVTAWK